MVDCRRGTRYAADTRRRKSGPLQQPSTIAPEETDSAQPDSIEDVPALVPPTTEVHRSFLDAMAEFAAEGRGRDDDKTMIGWEILAYRNRWDTPAGFADFIADLLAEADENTPRPPGIVPCTTLWWVEGHAYLGRLAIRHRLTPQLSEVGGHIGYDVRPSARNQGHGTGCSPQRFRSRAR
jgi:predicted acetyltransferase